MKKSGRTSLLSFAVSAALCGSACGGAPGKPDLPSSASPGWTLGNVTATSGNCWTAAYTGAGSANVEVCGYGSPAQALDAVQHRASAPETVQFQQGDYLVVVKWNGASQANITSLVRAIQKSLPAK